MALQNIIKTSGGADKRSAETHRLSAISNIENALVDETFTPEQRKRLKRLVRTLEDSAQDNPDRKLAVLEMNVIPALIGLGLVTP